MRRLIALLFVMTSLCLPSMGQTYIRNVNVLDVEKMRLVPGQTVVFSGDRIIGIGAVKKITIPSGATQIDGTGKYLMPGLVDAHVHFFQSGGLYTRPDVIDLRKSKPYDKEIEWSHRNMEDFLRRYTRAGITTVVDVGATLNFLQQRDSFRSSVYSPLVYMTGPLLTTWEPPVYKNLKNDEPFAEMKTEEDARRYVQQQLPYKPDFIKIWYIVLDADVEAGARKSLPLIRAVIDESHKNNLRVAVHATERITAQLAVENGCDFLVHGIDDEIVKDDLLQLMKKKNVVLSPTLVVASNYSEVLSQQYQLSYADYTLANPTTISSLFDLRHLSDTALVNRYRIGISRQSKRQERTDSILRVNTKRMADAGVVIATGTDAGNIGTLHASSYYEELEALRRAGLSNWQILQASTLNGAKIVGRDSVFGSIREGKMANMILLNANPLDSLASLQKVELVINKGQILKTDSVVSETPLALVQRQLNAYNGHDLEAFLEPYAEDVEIYQFPNKLEMKGKAAMRKAYQFIRTTPALHCELVNRVVHGTTIIDHERVRGFGGAPVEAVAIYEIEGRKIRRVYFVY